MALTAQVALSTRTYAAGNTPVPTFVIVVANPNAVAVVVTGLEIGFTDQLGNVVRPAAGPILPAIGQGQTTSVPANSTITIGPMAVAVGSVANADSFQMVPPGAQPANPQGSQPPQSELYVGALVYGSDGSVNIAGKDRLLVSYTNAPPQAYQGGYAQFSTPNNSILIPVVS